VVLELVAQFSVGAKPYIAHFWLPLIVIGCLVCFLLFLKSVKAKNIWAMVLFGIQAVILLLGNYLYNSNGTSFQNEMINQRSDAFGTMEQLDISIWLSIICALAFAGLIAFGVWHIKHYKKNYAKTALTPKKRWKWIYLSTSIVLLIIFCTTPIVDAMVQRSRPNYHWKLERNGDRNQQRGITTNIFYELLKSGPANSVSLKGLDQIDDFIYSSISPTSTDYFGKSSGNNLVMILAESLDTHVLDKYGADSEETKKLFPNLVHMMENGMNFTNFRQKEKTDTGELLSLLGNYPTKRFINYDFHKNEYPFSLPNMFGDAFPDAKKNYFHHSSIGIYNRDKVMPQIGFDNAYGVDEMHKLENEFKARKALTTIGWSSVERNLDTEVMRHKRIRDEMFPQGEQFFTYWTTFVSHGFYNTRKTLEPYYAEMDKLGLFPRGNKHDNAWRNYAATIMDFDTALGMMYTDLQEKGILDQTTIVVVSDHETYYQNLAFNSKKSLNQISSRWDSGVFKVPFFIYDKKLQNEHPELGTTEIDKFVTSGDIMPTILDLFGIKSWENLYLGTSAFADTDPSISFSRAYGYFFNDLMLFFNKNNLLWKSSDFTQADFDEFIQRAKVHLDKLFIIDKIYFSNHFKKNEYRIPL
jgi:phosphoglycerol transferase MdoB-like AlkP superfamily enzyme